MKLRFALSQLAESKRQRVSRYVMPYHERGCTRSIYCGEHRIDVLGKHNAL